MRHVQLTSAIFFFAIISVVAVPLLQGAHGQQISILTSADDHDGTFFGEAVLQIVINDPDADDDSTIEDITIDIDADPDSGSQASISVTVPETSYSSGRFEFYLVHSQATAVNPADIDPINSEGIEGDGSCVLDCAPFVTFGPTGDLQVDSDLFEEVNFELNTGDAEITVRYGEALAQVELDRSAYGSDSFVYVFVNDQDANLNPSAADEFTVDPDNTPNSDLLVLDGGSIETNMTFRETGDNTARFEARYELGASITFDSESLVLTLFDKANYGDTLDADENDSGSTDEVSFSIGDTDGRIDVGGGQTTWDAELSSDKTAYALGENVTIIVKDPDANSNPGSVEDIDLQISSSNRSAVIAATETGQNTGIFEASIQLDSEGMIVGTQLEVDEGAPLTITYTDEKPADYETRLENGENPEEEFVLEIDAVADSPTLSISLTPPLASRIGDSAGLLAGGQLGLSTTIENNNSVEQPFVTLIEVRDSSGITVYLAWQTGNLEPAGSTLIEVSWTPEVSGEYQVRSFAISSFTEPSVLSDVAATSLVLT